MDDKEKFVLESTHPITELYAYITRDVDGKEGVMTLFGKGGAYPLIGSDMKRMVSLRGVAETTAERYGRSLKLVKFSKREDLTNRHLPGLKGTAKWE